MVIRKMICLLLAFVFLLTISVPAFADENPPSAGSEIHPWDNADGSRANTGGPLTALRLPGVIVWYGFGTWNFAVYRVPATQATRTELSKERKASALDQKRISASWTRTRSR